MAEKAKKKTTKYKATDPERFAVMYNDSFPEYENLSKGKSVVLNKNNKKVLSWLINKTIVKE